MRFGFGDIIKETFTAKKITLIPWQTGCRHHKQHSTKQNLQVLVGLAIFHSAQLSIIFFWEENHLLEQDLENLSINISEWAKANDIKGPATSVKK